MALNLCSACSSEYYVTAPTEAYVFSASSYPRLEELADKAEAAIWTTAEIKKNMSKDLEQIAQGVIPKPVYKFVLHVQAFFTANDGLVNENIIINLLPKINIPASRDFLMTQMYMENIHGKVYGMFTKSYPMAEEKRKKYLNAIDSIPAIKDMRDWFQSAYFDYAHRRDNAAIAMLILYAACEEIIFFGPVLAGVGFLKINHWLPCFTLANDKISPDEALHGEHLCALLELVYLQYLPKEKVIKVIMEACDLSMNLGAWLLKRDLPGLSLTGMKQYSKFISDRMLNMIGLQKVYNVPNPFAEWMKIMDISSSKTSFHDWQPSEYQRPKDDNEEPDW